MTHNFSKVHSLGSAYVNWYILETEEGMTIIDAGLPIYYHQLLLFLEQSKKQLKDVKAIVLTHGHADHIGFAEKLRTTANVDVWVHEADKALTMKPDDLPPKKFLKNIWRPSIFLFMLHLIRSGAVFTSGVKVVKTYKDGDILNVPGKLKVFHTPGHSEGQCSLLFEEKKILFSGDTMSTCNLHEGRFGLPQILSVNEDVLKATESLAKLSKIGEVTILPGHGKAWHGQITEAINYALDYQKIRKI